MRKITNFSVFAFILLFFSIIDNAGMAQAKADITGFFNPSFELRDGDRVVFVGNSLLENDLQYGYLELALTTRWPFQDVTFRNLGWSGDTVSGKARSYITAPSAYDLLIEQIKDAEPTVVFIAYGGNEAFGGREDLPHFLRGLNQLLNEIDLLGARAVLLSPIPMMSAKSAEIYERS